MASAAVDNAKALVDEQLALLRVKLNQTPALQEVEQEELEEIAERIAARVARRITESLKIKK